MDENHRNSVMILWMAQVLCTVIRGCLSVFPQERVEKVLILLSGVMGQQLAASYVGDEFSVRKYRKACRDAFCEAINREKVGTAGVPAPPVQETASIGVSQ